MGRFARKVSRALAFEPRRAIARGGRLSNRCPLDIESDCSGERSILRTVTCLAGKPRSEYGRQVCWIP